MKCPNDITIGFTNAVNSFDINESRCTNDAKYGIGLCCNLSSMVMEFKVFIKQHTHADIYG